MFELVAQISKFFATLLMGVLYNFNGPTKLFSDLYQIFRYFSKIVFFFRVILKCNFGVIDYREIKIGSLVCFSFFLCVFVLSLQFKNDNFFVISLLQ